MTKIDNPFDGEAYRLIQEHGASEQVARDFVVLRHLHQGDTRALAHWIEQDYWPGKEVRRMLSLMLQPTRYDADAPEISFEVGREVVPYSLEVKRRDGKRGPKNDPVADERNQAIADIYHRLMNEKGRGFSDSVILDMVKELEPDISESKIREATKKRSPKSR